MKPRKLKTLRSKLETNVDILKVLAQKGPSKLTPIMNKANVNSRVLREYLAFLVKQGLVEERIIKKQSGVFAITQRGINVLKYFREIPKVISSIEVRRQRNSTELSY